MVAGRDGDGGCLGLWSAGCNRRDLRDDGGNDGGGDGDLGAL